MSDAKRVLDEWIRMFEVVDYLLDRCEAKEDSREYWVAAHRILREKGLIDDDEIISDPFYDREAVQFVLRVLKKIREELDRI